MNDFDHEDAMSFPLASIDGSLAAAAAADQLCNDVQMDTGSKITTDQRIAIQRILGPELGYLFDIANKAGRLAGEGDYLGALVLLGEQNARILLGDDETEALIIGASYQMSGEIGKD